ncbi:MAG TPA: ImmA/IrrE family metallo-endopeptidase [Chitinophagaceae bacterium]|jgi:Zn-dependent peptidase ImmA (M78 family)|nr:ImmA/IrrE family metallo-endopeptidase [Chitinophagaceae bacterium]
MLIPSAVIIKKAHDLVRDCNEAPVDVIEIANTCGVTVLPYHLDNVSGVLVLKNGQPTIGFNQLESRVRNRFTIAHELGHYILHGKQEMVSDASDLFVDKDFKVRFRGNQESSKSEEIEANKFAAYLLMPDHLLKQEIENLEFSIEDESSIIDLAKKFDVSSIAMSIRLGNFGLFNSLK